jgi:hypothetical protein
MTMTTRQRNDADDGNNNADGEGRRRTDDATAHWRRGVVLPASLDERRCTRLCLAATALRRQDDDDGR